MTNAKLLIVEDDKDRVARLKYLLAPNYRLTFARTAKRAVHEIDSHQRFDVAIIDWRLPIDNRTVPEPNGGLGVMREINERCPSVPVIITYSWDTPEEIRKKISSLKNLHVVGILEKPLLLDELANSIKRALPKAGATG